jgi:dTDP-4-dehydrorhamnose reductase
MPPRAGNVSMDSRKLRSELGGEPFRPWPLGDDLLPTQRRWHFERPAHEARSPQQIEERLYRYPDGAATRAG